MELIASTTDIPEGELIESRAGDKEILIGCVDGQYFALEDVCPHAWVRFGFAQLDKTTLTCPWHGLQFNVLTGECLSWEGMPEITTFPLTVEEGQIFLNDPESKDEGS